MTQESKSKNALSGWWLTNMPAERLAGVRIVCGLYAIWYLLPRWDMFYDLWRTDSELFAPVGVARLLPGIIPSAGMLDTVYWVTVAAAILFTLGVKHRLTGPAFGLLILTLLSYRNSWSMIFHMHNGLVVHALILGLTKSADVWSFDALFNKRRRDPTQSKVSWQYGWPIMLIGAATISCYFLSGVAKVAGPEGFAWASGESLRAQVAVNAIRYDILLGSSASLFGTLYEQTWLFWAMGIGTLILELGAPLALANRRLGVAWVILILGLHWGVFFIMGIKFRYQMSGIAFASFFNLEKINPLLRSAKRWAGSFKTSSPSLAEPLVRSSQV